MSLPVRLFDVGQMAYSRVLEIQSSLASEVASGAPDALILCEHPPVITLGRGTRPGQVGEGQMLPVVEVSRGGGATVHLPGQLVGYPIFNLAHRNKDLHGFLRSLESVLVGALAKVNVPAGIRDGLTGVWTKGSPPRKIASIGIAVKRWVTFHGFALNINPDLAAFESIHPCGLDAGVMTSCALELNQVLSLNEVKSHVQVEMERVFSVSLKPAILPGFEEKPLLALSR